MKAIIPSIEERYRKANDIGLVMNNNLNNEIFSKVLNSSVLVLPKIDLFTPTKKKGKKKQDVYKQNNKPTLARCDIANPYVDYQKKLALKLPVSNTILKSNILSSSANLQRWQESNLNNHSILDPVGSRNLNILEKKSIFEVNKVRKCMIKGAETIINTMPLSYLYSKPELRNYAMNRIFESLRKPDEIRIKEYLKIAFKIWKRFKLNQFLTTNVFNMNEKQLGCLVISKQFFNLFNQLCYNKFYKWAFYYSSRYNAVRSKRLNLIATEIQTWYRHCKLLRKEPFRRFTEAVLSCLHKRRAIKHLVQFEMSRRNALEKIRKAIVTRRRYYFAARSIQRVYRWLKLLRRVSIYLIRVNGVRKIKRWYQKVTKRRSSRDKVVIKLLCRCGGYTQVMDKMPQNELSSGLFEGIDLLVRKLQRSWFRCIGKLALYQAFAARRAKLMYQKMINEKATTLQNNVRAYLWRLLMHAARINIRARRIQRAYRSFKWRSAACEGTARLQVRRIRRLQHWVRRVLWRKHLIWRFLERRRAINLRLCQEQDMALLVQRVYRGSAVRKREKRLAQQRYYSAQRDQLDVVLKFVWCFQRNWRQLMTPYLFPRHVLRCCQNIIRRQHNVIHRSACILQHAIRRYLNIMRDEKFAIQSAAAHVIWHFTKSYLLKYGIYLRILATRERRIKAANRIKRGLRGGFWLQLMGIRFVLQRLRLDLKKLRHAKSAVIQLWYRRKVREYNMPLRVAGRTQLKKRREREEAERVYRIRHAASYMIQRLVKRYLFVCRSLRKIDKVRVYYRQRRAQKKNTQIRFDDNCLECFLSCHGASQGCGRGRENPPAAHQVKQHDRLLRQALEREERSRYKIQITEKDVGCVLSARGGAH